MQRKSLTAACLFFAAALGALGTGCQSEAPATAPPSPYAGLKLQVACPAGPAAAVVRTYSKSWEGRHGATVEVLPYERKDPRGPASAGAADLWVIAPAELPHWADSEVLAPLPDSYRDPANAYGWTGLLPLYHEEHQKLLQWGRQGKAAPVWGLPLLGEAPVFCYYGPPPSDDRDKRNRTDKAVPLPDGLPAPFPEGPPATWEQLAEVAEAVAKQRQTRAEKQGAKTWTRPLPPLPTDEEALEREFYTIAACYVRLALKEAGPERDADKFSFHFDHQTGRPQIDGPGFVRALELLKRLQPLREPSLDKVGPERAFLEGQAIACLTEAPAVSTFQTHKESKVRNRFSVGRMPGSAWTFDSRTGKMASGATPNRVPYLGAGGWLGVVPKDSAHTAAAFDLLAELTGKATSAQIVQEPRWGGGPVRLEQVMSGRDGLRWDAFELEGPRTAQFKSALEKTVLHEELTNPVVRLRTPDEKDYRADLVKGLRDALLGKTEPAQALQDVARDWDKRIEKRGPDRHREEYRQSLGLTSLRARVQE